MLICSLFLKIDVCLWYVYCQTYASHHVYFHLKFLLKSRLIHKFSFRFIFEFKIFFFTLEGQKDVLNREKDFHKIFYGHCTLHKGESCFPSTILKPKETWLTFNYKTYLFRTIIKSTFCPSFRLFNGFSE